MQDSKDNDQTWRLSSRRKEENWDKKKIKVRSWPHQWMLDSYEAQRLSQNDTENNK